MPGQPRREHRLAAARRADHQQVVAAGGGDLQRPLRLLLALDVGEVLERGGVGTVPGCAGASAARPVKWLTSASSDFGAIT